MPFAPFTFAHGSNGTDNVRLVMSGDTDPDTAAWLDAALELMGQTKPYQLYGERHELYRRPALKSEAGLRAGFFSILYFEDNFLRGCATCRCFSDDRRLLLVIDMLRTVQSKRADRAGYGRSLMLVRHPHCCSPHPRRY